jgi:DNA-binding transcriptional LysR family regulator
MNERQLRSFLAVVDEGTVTRAALRLHVAQPSLSQTLRAVETDVGARLFERAGRGLRLTTAGEALIGPARQALQAIDDARASVSEVVELRSGTVRLASLATLAVAPVAGLIGRFRRRYPGIRIHVFESETLDDVVSLVASGSCDLGIGHLAVVGPGLVLHALGEQRLVLVFPPSQQVEKRGAVPLETLAQTPFVVSPAGTSTRTLLEDALAAVGITPNIAVETAAREAIIPLVLADAGAALLPTPLADEAARRGATIRATSPPITRPVALIHRANLVGAAARAFIEEATRTNLVSEPGSKRGTLF